MEARRMKRKRYEVVKNDLSVQLNNLTTDSGNLNNDLHTAVEDFELMCKSITDRQADILTRSLLLEEKYGETLDVLNGGKVHGEGESSGENVVLAPSYANDIQKFVVDSSDSLRGHGVFMSEEYEEMGKVFEKYQNLWKQNLIELKKKAENIATKRAKLSTKLLEFNRYVVEEEDTD